LNPKPTGALDETQIYTIYDSLKKFFSDDYPRLKEWFSRNYEVIEMNAGKIP
jgi:hypothetical protein